MIRVWSPINISVLPTIPIRHLPAIPRGNPTAVTSRYARVGHNSGLR
jgi:hypothetical protein